jgi:hypothetical protein
MGQHYEIRDSGRSKIAISSVLLVELPATYPQRPPYANAKKQSLAYCLGRRKKVAYPLSSNFKINKQPNV